MKSPFGGTHAHRNVRRILVTLAAVASAALAAHRISASAQDAPVEDASTAGPGNAPEGAIDFSPATSRQAAKTTYVVVSCNDGDTCRLKSADNVSIKVRLVGIDAPEFGGKKKKGQPLSAESKDFLNGLVQGKSVTLNALGSDAFNRTLAEIYVGETNANVALVRAGLAEVYRGRPPKGLDVAAYARAETEAKATRKGVWALQDYQSPKDYRKKNK